ncbi:ATP cone domain-containing protein [Patescibacteria group bacterium]
MRKKDGVLQDYNRQKVVAGMVRSGASQEEAEKVAIQVETWAQSTAIEGVVSTVDLRAKVLEVLQSVSTQAAENYSSYRKVANPQAQSSGQAAPASMGGQTIPEPVSDPVQAEPVSTEPTVVTSASAEENPTEVVTPVQPETPKE